MEPDATTAGDSIAMQHRARRAALLAAQITRVAEFVEADPIEYCSGLGDHEWSDLAADIADQTGRPFRPPSEITRAMVLGILTAPQLAGIEAQR